MTEGSYIILSISVCADGIHECVSISNGHEAEVASQRLHLIKLIVVRFSSLFEDMDLSTSAYTLTF